MKQAESEDLLKKILSKVQGKGAGSSMTAGRPNSQYSSLWEWFLASKGGYHSLGDMLDMRSPTSSVTRGFGLDRRFSPSSDYYREHSVYQDILSIPEPDFGNPEKLFYGANSERRSGIFLRNACYAYEIVTRFGRNRDDPLTILEIGPGFGMLAYILKVYYKNARLYLVDLPETLAICAWYLENTLRGCSSLYWPADSGTTLAASDIVMVNAEAFTEGMAVYDLVVNCDSMSEMTSDVSRNYLRIIEADTADKGMFFFLNKEGIDKEAVARPTLYPFSPQWTLESIRPTYVGFLDDYRHVQMCLRSSTRQLDLPVLRNRLLDLAYQYFYNERLECFDMFAFLENWERHMSHLSDQCRNSLPECIGDGDITHHIQSWRVIHGERGKSESNRLISRLCTIITCDGLLDARLDSEALPLALELGKDAQSFAETWAAGRILTRLNEERRAREVLARSLEIEGVSPSLLLKAGKWLEDSGHVDLAQRAFERVLNETSYPLEKIEAGMRLRMGLGQIDTLCATLPRYVFSIGYYLVRIAGIYQNNGYGQEACNVLSPIVERQLETGHYDLFAAAQILDAVGSGEKAEPLIQEAIKLGHNDNGFYRRIGLFFEQKGDLSSAVKYLRMSLDIDASWGSTYRDLARIYQKLGQTDLEVEHLKQVLLRSHNREVDYDAVSQRLRSLAHTTGG